MIGNREVKKGLSTSALAKELNKNSQEMFQQLSNRGWIIRNGNNWDLTPSGGSKGGAYRENEQYGRYIVWPDSIKAQFGERLPESGIHLVTSTNIGKQFEISAMRTNFILSELGLIENGDRGWVLTELGKRLGGKQSHDKISGVPYVRWPESIKNNKMLLASICEIKGEIPITDPNQHQNTSSETLEFRDKFKPNLRATDGHFVRSKSELLIDNWLYWSGCAHAYERKLPIEEKVFSDFYLPAGKVYIEYWGYEKDSSYVVRKEEKLGIYKKYDFHLIELSEKEVQNLDDYLPRLLLGFGVRIE